MRVEWLVLCSDTSDGDEFEHCKMFNDEASAVIYVRNLKHDGSYNYIEICVLVRDL